VIVAGGLQGAENIRSNEKPAQVRATYGRLPLSFEINQGQTDAEVTFLARGPGYTLFLTATEAVLVVRGSGGAGVVRAKLVGANARARVSGLEPLPGRSNYFIGSDPTKWRTDVPHYRKVRFAEVYRGIDLVYYATNEGQLEYDFIVQPGADPEQIRLGYEGAQRIQLSAGGDLMVHAEEGELRLHRPDVYQRVEGERREIAGGFVLLDNNQVGFEVGAYDVEKPLIVDPILSYSTYLGGNEFDFAGRLATDAGGSAYVTGGTPSIDFPTSNALQPGLQGPSDAFIVKLSPTGETLVYSTFLGGSAGDQGGGIAVDTDGNVYVVGGTASPDFPTINAFQNTLNGPSNIFLSKLNSVGDALIHSTYLGGSSGQFVAGVVVDAAGSAYLAGTTDSNDFPTTPGALDTICGTGGNCAFGSEDIFVTKFSPTGSTLIYSTYLGGNDRDLAGAPAVDSQGNAYLTGETHSTDFPTTPGTFDPGPNSGIAAFATQLNPQGSGLVYSSLLRGSGGFARGSGVAVDGNGNAYVAGDTVAEDFPTTPGAFDTECAPVSGCWDTWVTKLNVDGSGLVYSTFLGGGSFEIPRGIAVDADGTAYVTGFTFSSDFPLANPIQASLLGGFSDVFVAALNTDGSALVFSTYLGGTGADDSRDIAVGSDGSVYVTGPTSSVDFPVASAFQELCLTQNLLATCNDVFVAKISPGDVTHPTPTVANVSPSNVMVGEPGLSLTVEGTNFIADSIVRVRGANRTTTFVSGSELQALVLPGDLAISGDAEIKVFNVGPGGGASNGAKLLVREISANPAPLIFPSGVVNSASFAPGAAVAPGSIAAVFGQDLAFYTTAALATPLPTNLGRAEMQFNSSLGVPKFYASPFQINLQVPWELAGQAQASLVDNLEGTLSNSEAVNLVAFAPGLFATNQQGFEQGAILIAGTGGVFAAPAGIFPTVLSRPAVRGVDFLEIYCTGLGPVTNQPATGAAAGINPLSSVPQGTPVGVTIGGVPATVLFAGLAPGFVGLYVVDVQVPAGAPPGDAVPVVLTIGGVMSNTVTIAVQ